MSWRAWRPAIWFGMAGVGALILVNVYVGVALLGASLGITLRLFQRRNRRA